MGLAYDEAVQKLQTGMLPSLIAINAMIKDMGGSWEAFGSAIGKSLEFVAAMIKGVADLKKALSLPSTPDTVQSVTPDEAGQQRAAAGQQPLSAEQQAWAKRRQAERLRLQWERAQKNNELPPGESAATAGIKKLFGLDPKGAPGALDEPAPTGPGTPGAAPPPTDAEIRAERKRKILAPPTPPAPAGPNELGLPSLDFDSITKENDLRIQQMQEDIRGAPNAAAIEAARKRRILAPAPVANPVSFQTEGGANPLLHSGGDEGGGGAGMFKNAIRVGVFEGMIDFSNYLKGGSAAGGGAGGGIQNASFQMPGGGGLPSNIKIPGEVGPRGADTPISRAFASAGTPTAAAPPTAATPSPGAPNGSHVGPGTGPGAGNTPADGGGAGVKGGAGAAGGRAAEAMEYFKSQGWSHEQAAGLAANLNAESGFKTGARGDAGSAGGIAQWHGDRQKAIEKQFGKPLSQMSYQEQLAAVNWELSKGGPEARAGAALRATKTAREAGATASRLYERPKNVRGEMARRGAAAEGYAAMPPVSSTTSEAKSGTGDHPIPGAVIEKAHSVAQLGPAALSKWMASQGYPQHDQWCGDFAAAVVKSAGGTPPKGWALASNWRNVGPEVSAEDAQPGDVAVARPGWSRRGSGRTGEAGSHVTILNEKLGGGKFAGLGGNQGHGRIGRFNTGQFQFYRPNVGGNGDGSAALDRSALDRGTEHRVHGTGKLSVDVKAPRGTKVDAEGDGLFKKTEIDRQTQMEPAQSAPRRGGGGDETISI
jgi:hypothetical protein